MKRDAYQSTLLPLRSSYNDLTKKQADDKFKWFLAQIPEHVSYLIKNCSKDMGLSEGALDYSDGSILPLWTWFVKYGEVRPYTREERIEKERLFGHLGPSMVGSKCLTYETELMVQDIGLYVAEVFLHNYDVVKWDYVRKPKSDMFFQNPVITGFLDTNYQPAFRPFFQPIHMAGVQAARMIDDTATPNDLLNIYKLWAGYAQNAQNE